MRRFGLLLLAVLTVLCAAVPSAGAADPERARQWGLDLIEADAAHSVTRGDGAVVAVIDTGVDAAHPDLAGRLLSGRDFVDRDDVPQDGDGHGTHVTGIIAAASGNGIGVESVAPDARVLPIRVLGDDGSGSDEQVAAGIDFAVAQKADVINLSLGGLPLTAFESSGPFYEALSRAAASGAVVVVAAGNDALPICEQPALDGAVLCVGAVDRGGNRSFFSSGDSASIMAPGGAGMGGDTDVLSTFKGGGYETVAGTSQAAPHVAGVAALLASRGVRGQGAVDRILATATPKQPSLLYGYGILNAKAAVAGLPAASGGGSGSGSGESGGGGGSAGGGSGGSSDAAVLRLARVQKIAKAKKGFKARCHATAAGRCTVTVKRGKTLVFRGLKKVAAGQTVVVSVKPTAAGRSLLARGRAFTAVARLAAPGAPAKSVRLKFRR